MTAGSGGPANLDAIEGEAADHRAIVECCYPPSIELIASGSSQFCRDSLVAWTEKHPTPQWSRAYVVAVTDEVICEPGVGVYVVARAERDAARAAVERVRARAASEIADAKAGASYAGEVNQGVLLAAEDARRFAWESAVRALDPGAEPGQQR